MKKWFICPDGGEQEITKCLDGWCRMGNRCAPMSYLNMAGEEREWTGRPSTTQLINGTRLEYLKLTTDFATDPAKQMFAITGTRSHAELEKYQNKFSFLEEKLGDNEMSGIIDCLEVQTDGSWWLIDNKIIGSYKIAKVMGIERYSVDLPLLTEDGNFILNKSGKNKGKPKTKKDYRIRQVESDAFEYELQLNRYRIFAEEALKEKIQKLMLFMVPRDGGTYIAESRGIENRPYYHELPILDNDYVLEYFAKKREALLHALDNRIFPSKCNDQECWDGKRCEGWCEVSKFCQEAT